jgi:hypothetical protein
MVAQSIFQVKCLKFKVPKVPKVKGTKMTITCFGPVFIGLRMGFLYYELRDFAPIGILARPGLRLRFSPRRRIVPLRAGGQPVGPTGRRVEPTLRPPAHRGLRPGGRARLAWNRLLLLYYFGLPCESVNNYYTLSSVIAIL